jgi:hypothetical protein
MANPFAGEVDLRVNGITHSCKLTLGALAEMEAGSILSMVDLVARFEGGQVTSADVLALIVAGLRGGGWQGTAADLLTADIAGGPVKAAQVAALLLARAFAPPT